MKLMMALAALALVAAPVTAYALLSVDTSYVVDGGETYYLSDDGGLYYETNDLEGLQEKDTTLEDGSVVPADEKVLQ